MMDAGTLLTAASLIGAFGTSILVFRLQRELQISEGGEPNWIPWADRLMIVATVISFLVAGVLLVFRGATTMLRFASAGLAGAAILATGYPLAILAHYRLLQRSANRGLRTNPEGIEGALVIAFSILAVISAIGAFVSAGGGLTGR